MQIILKLTTACNLGCVYCIEGDQKKIRMPEEIFFKCVDELPELLSEIGTKDAEFLFHGGEPMLYGRESIGRLIDYACEHLPEYHVRFLMQTNGTLIDDDWVEFFKQRKVSVGISLDGYPEIHDRTRRTKSGDPTSAVILRNIRKLREAGLRIGTLMVMNSAELVDADKLFEFIRDNDLQPKIHPVVPCGRAANQEDTDEVASAYVAVMKRLFERALSENMQESIQPLDEIMNAILGIAPVCECSFNGSCGKGFVCLYPDGMAGFCGRDNLARNMVYGSLYDTSLSELYHSDNARRIRYRQEYLKSNDCKGCAEWEFCHGGCAFEAMNSFGKLETRFANCGMRKELIRYLRTDGMKLMKKALVQEKVRLRRTLKAKSKLLGEIDGITLNEEDAINGAS